MSDAARFAAAELPGDVSAWLRNSFKYRAGECRELARKSRARFHSKPASDNYRRACELVAATHETAALVYERALEAVGSEGA